MNEHSAIATTREWALGWLRSMDAPGSPPGVKRASALHDTDQYPGMRLPATYNAWHCLVLLQADEDTETRQAVGDFVRTYQAESGTFRIPEMRDSEVYKRDDPVYTWEYIDFHVTNYALGILSSLGRDPIRPLHFMNQYETPEGFSEWISRRQWDDPWMEGNLVVNLASFLEYRARRGHRYARQRLSELLDYLRHHQDVATGYWGDDTRSTSDQLLSAMAGAAHDYHVFSALGETVPHVDRVIDSTLEVATSQLEGVSSACLDIDVVDILASLNHRGYRSAEIEAYLHRKLTGLLAFQNADGGFADQRSGTRTFDGWPQGYAEPQGKSNCFATWFRMATIAMIDSVLWPERASSWTFRDTLGMGYFQKSAKAAESGRT